MDDGSSYLQLLYGNTFNMTIVAIQRDGSLLSEVPRIENVNFAEMERQRRASKITDRYRVGSLVSAVLYRSQLFDLTLHEELFLGECLRVY